MSLCLENQHWAAVRNQEETESASIPADRKPIASFDFVEQCRVVPDGATCERLRRSL